MRRNNLVRWRLAWAILLPTTGAWASPLTAQYVPSARFGVGYVTNAPLILGGASAHVLLPTLGGFGIYVDAKFDIAPPSDDDGFVSSLTAKDIEEQVQGVMFLRDRKSWRSFNAALMRPLSQTFTLYAGGGYSERTVYREYQDPSGNLGFLGFVVAEDPEQFLSTVNVMVGAFFRLSSAFDFQMGFESAPRGFTVGGSLRIPPT